MAKWFGEDRTGQYMVYFGYFRFQESMSSRLDFIKMPFNASKVPPAERRRLLLSDLFGWWLPISKLPPSSGFCTFVCCRVASSQENSHRLSKQSISALSLSPPWDTVTLLR